MQVSASLREQHEKHKATRAILFQAPVAIETKQAIEIRALKAEATNLRSEIEQREAEIRQLKMDLADRNARVLDQAHKLCQLMRIEESDEEPRDIRPVKDIVDEVLRDYPDVTWAQIISVRRTRDLIGPRHRCYFEVYKQRPDLSFPAIGRYFKRDHTSILSGVKKYRTGEERE